MGEGYLPGNMSLTDQASCENDKHILKYITQSDYHRHHERDMLYNKLCKLPDFETRAKAACYPVDMQAAAAFDVDGKYIIKDRETELENKVADANQTLQALREAVAGCPTQTVLTHDGLTLNTECRTTREEKRHNYV